MEDAYTAEEGWNTLIADPAVLHLDRIVADLEKMREQGASEEVILRHLKTHFETLDPESERKVYQLSLGQTPPDDFSPHQLERARPLNESTLELKLKESDERCQPGTLVFLEGHRWFITATRGKEVLLKKF